MSEVDYQPYELQTENQAKVFENANSWLGDDYLELDPANDRQSITLPPKAKNPNIDFHVDEANMEVWIEISIACEGKGSIQVTLSADRLAFDSLIQSNRSAYSEYQDCELPDEQIKRYRISRLSKFMLPVVQVENRSFGKVRLNYIFTLESTELDQKVWSSSILDQNFDKFKDNGNLNSYGIPPKKIAEIYPPQLGQDSSFLLLGLLFFCVLLCIVILAARVAAGRDPNTDDNKLVLIPELFEKETKKCTSKESIAKFSDGS